MFPPSSSVIGSMNRKNTVVGSPGTGKIGPLARALHYAVYQRRRIKTEEKAKVVVAPWGAESINFFVALAILHQDDLKNRMICTRTI